KGAPYVEEDAPAPLSVYGRSKAHGEQAVLAAHPSALVVRTSWVYGTRGRNFLTSMLQLADKQEVVRVVVDQYGSPTGGVDLAAALLAMGQGMREGPGDISPGIYHVAGAGEASWLGLAEAIYAGWARRGHRVPTIQSIPLSAWPSAARRPCDSRLDCAKAE